MSVLQIPNTQQATHDADRTESDSMNTIDVSKFATKEDMRQQEQSIRNEQHRHEDRLVRAIDSQNAKFDRMIELFDSKIDKLEAKIDSKIDKLETKIETNKTTLEKSIADISKNSFSKKDAWIMFLLGALVIMLLLIFLPDKTTTLLTEILSRLPTK